MPKTKRTGGVAGGLAQKLQEAESRREEMILERIRLDALRSKGEPVRPAVSVRARTRHRTSRH